MTDSAYLRGLKAAESGKSMDSCPYRWDSKSRKSRGAREKWIDGFDDGWRKRTAEEVAKERAAPTAGVSNES